MEHEGYTIERHGNTWYAVKNGEIMAWSLSTTADKVRAKINRRMK